MLASLEREHFDWGIWRRGNPDPRSLGKLGTRMLQEVLRMGC